MKLNLAQIRENLHLMDEEERVATISLLATLGVNIEFKPKPIIPRIPSLSSYWMRRDKKCLTCRTETSRWYACSNLHGVTSATFMYQGKSTPPEAFSIHVIESVTAVCNSCDEVLSSWPQQKLIDLIKLRRFFSHAEDHKLYYNPRGDEPSTSSKPNRRRTDVPSSGDES